VLWDVGSNGGELREGELRRSRKFDRELEFYWDFQVFLCLCKRGFLKEEGEKNEKSTKGRTYSAIKGGCRDVGWGKKSEIRNHARDKGAPSKFRVAPSKSGLAPNDKASVVLT
jgi:hypothetical protein